MPRRLPLCFAMFSNLPYRPRFTRSRVAVLTSSMVFLPLAIRRQWRAAAARRRRPGSGRGAGGRGRGGGASGNGRCGRGEQARGERDLTGRGTILLVEDEDGLRALNARGLASRGYTVLEAGNGVEAIDVLEKADGQVDLVISDVVMPEMDVHDRSQSEKDPGCVRNRPDPSSLPRWLSRRRWCAFSGLHYCSEKGARTRTRHGVKKKRLRLPPLPPAQVTVVIMGEPPR